MNAVAAAGQRMLSRPEKKVLAEGVDLNASRGVGLPMSLLEAADFVLAEIKATGINH